MEDDDDDSGFVCDVVYGRVQAVRNIAMDLETVKNKDGRELLIKAGELALQHLALKSAPIVELVPNAGKALKEKPL
jgi:hypothetical protein